MKAYLSIWIRMLSQTLSSEKGKGKLKESDTAK